VVNSGFIFWNSPPDSSDTVARYRKLKEKDAILLLDFLPNQPFDYWKGITFKSGKIVYTTSTNLALAAPKKELNQ
jgi:hypothetical protein